MSFHSVERHSTLQGGYRMDYRRWGALGGIVFATLVVAVNVIIGSSAKPEATASASEVAAWYSGNISIPIIVSILAPIIWISLPVFAAGMLAYTRSRSEGVNPWAVMAVAGVVMQNAIFSGVVATDSILATRATELATQPQFTALLWDLNHAAMTLNHASLVIAAGGLAMALLTSRVAPTWLGGLGLVAAGLFSLSAIQVVPALEASPTSLVVFPAFFAWVAFVAIASVTMLRRAPMTADTSVSRAHQVAVDPVAAPPVS
jgi:hypothetical protein